MIDIVYMLSSESVEKWIPLRFDVLCEMVLESTSYNDNMHVKDNNGAETFLFLMQMKQRTHHYLIIVYYSVNIRT